MATMTGTVLISGFFAALVTTIVFGVVVAVLCISNRIRRSESDYIVTTRRGWTVIIVLGLLSFALLTAMTTVTFVS